MLARALRHDVYRLSRMLGGSHEYRKLAALRRAVTGQISLAGFDRTQSIFVHIPKTAGVSVNYALYGNLGGSHRSIAQYELAFSARDFDRYFKFCFVRNPWDRTYSAYRFLKRGGMDEEDRRWAAGNLSGFADFEEFVTKWLNEENVKTWMHFWPQHTLLRSRLDGRIRIDYVGRFESLTADFMFVAKRLGIDATLPRTNSSGSVASYRDAYGRKTREIVGKVYNDDVQLFDYSFT